MNFFLTAIQTALIGVLSGFTAYKFGASVDQAVWVGFTTDAIMWFLDPK